MTKDQYILEHWETKPIHEICSDINISKWTFNRTWAELHKKGLVPETKPFVKSRKAVAKMRESNSQKVNTDEAILKHIKENYRSRTKHQMRDDMRCGRRRFNSLYKMLVDLNEIDPDACMIGANFQKARNMQKLKLSDKELIDLAETTDLDRDSLAHSLGISPSRLRHRLAEARKALGVVSKYNGHIRKKSKVKIKPIKRSVLTMPWVDSKWISNVKWRGDYGCSVY